VDQTTHQIESNIERTRDRLGANLYELEHKVKQLGDWRHHYSNHPLLLVGAAFGGGVLLATMLAPGKRTQLASSLQLSPGFNGSSEGRSVPPVGPQVTNAWDHMRDALLGVAATRVTEFLGDLVPGFAEEFRSKGGFKTT
jgi:hypothetical protein